MFFLQTQTPLEYVSIGSYVGIYYEAIVIISIVLLLIDFYLYYRSTKMRMSLDIFNAFVCFTIAAFFSWIAKWYWWQHKFYKPETYAQSPFFLQLIFDFRLSMIMLIIGNYFFFNFFTTIFSKSSKHHPWKKLRIILKIIEILIILTSQIISDLLGLNETILSYGAISFIIMFLDTTFLIPFGIKIFKKVRIGDFDRKYLNIGIAGFLMFNMCIMFLIDNITMTLGIPGPFGEAGYTVFYFAGWASADIAIIFLSFGFHRKLTEEDITFYKEQKKCLVCKGRILRINYICPRCDAIYCIKCSEALSDQENACWVCQTPFDPSKPTRIQKEKIEKKKKYLKLKS